MNNWWLSRLSPKLFEVAGQEIQQCFAIFWLHLRANLVEPGSSLWDKLVNGAPPVAPLLFPNLVALAWIGLWSLTPHLPEPDDGRSWMGAIYAWTRTDAAG